MRRLGGVGGGLARAWLLAVLVPLLGDLRASAAAPQRLAASSLSPLRGTITDVGRADPNRRHSAVVGLVDCATMRALPRARAVPLAVIGTNCCHLGPPDVATFYGNRPELDGSGETVVIAGVYAWRESDNTTFNARWGLPPLPAGSGQVCTGQSTASGCQFSTANSLEIALDVEYLHV